MLREIERGGQRIAEDGALASIIAGLERLATGVTS
jgi:hypothetical protein